MTCFGDVGRTTLFLLRSCNKTLFYDVLSFYRSKNVEFCPFQVKANGDCLYLAVRKSLKILGALSVLEM